MKENIVLAFVMMVLFSSIVAGALTDDYTTQIASGARLRVTMLNQDPDPAEPGKYVELRWKVENTGSMPATDVVFELLESYPFSLEPGVPSTKELGTVLGRQYDDEGAVLYYKMIVDDGAVEGDNEIKLRYKVGKNGEWVTLDAFTIRLQTVDAALSFESIEMLPDHITPGDEAEVKITLKNLADSAMKDITLRLDLAMSSVQAVSATDAKAIWDALPFVPLKSTTEKRIKRLGPGESETLVYNLVSYPDAESRTYKVPLALTFYDELEKKYEKHDIIGIRVGADPEMLIDIDSSTVYGKGTGEVTVKFVNKGVSDIKFLYATLGTSPDYEITSSALNYVGNVDSDDYETADFSLFVKNSKDLLDLPLHIEYMDANNEKYEEDISLKLRIFSDEERGVEKKGGATTLVIVVILIVAGWFVYKRWEKKRKLNSNGGQKK